MKKISTMLIVFAMVIAMTGVMAACGSESDDGVSSQNQASSGAGDASAYSEENSSVQREEASGPLSANDALQGGSDAEESAGDDTSGTGSNILIAYFSRVGNTVWEDGVETVTSASLNVDGGEYVGNAEYLARMVQAATGGDLFLIQTEEAYPSDYRETTDVAAEEQDEDARPVLASHVENMDSYEIIVLIYPNWWGSLPQPLFTFLEEYDFSGKTILPLCTHEGSRLGRSADAIARLCPDAVLLDGLAIRGSDASSVQSQSDVEAWIAESGILGS